MCETVNERGWSQKVEVKARRIEFLIIEISIIGLIRKSCDFQAKALIIQTSKKGQKHDKNQMQISFF